jgi:hypothetical protein
MLAFAPDRVRSGQFWGVLSPICDCYQLKADFFNTLVCSPKLDFRSLEFSEIRMLRILLVLVQVPGQSRFT